MLDAAHGKTVSAVVVVQRVHDACVEAQVTRVDARRGVRRRRPGVAARADIRQGSRLTVAVARSSNVNRNRWNECRKETFLMNNE